MNAPNCRIIFMMELRKKRTIVSLTRYAIRTGEKVVAIAGMRGMRPDNAEW